MTNTKIDPIPCRCGAHWTGLNRAHCSACHITFGGVASFDRHRAGGRCMSLEDIINKLQLNDNGKGVYTSTYGVTDESNNVAEE